MRNWKTWLKLSLTVLLLGMLLRLVGWRETWATLRRAHPGYLGLAVLLYMLTMWVRAWRWQVFLEGQGIRVSVSRLTYLYFVGSFFNMVLPSGMGGDVVKYYELARHDRGDHAHFRARVASSVLADRMCGLMVLFLMGTAVVPWARGLDVKMTLALLVALTVVSIAGVALLLNKRVRAWAETHIPLARALINRRGIRGLYASLDGYTRPVLVRATLYSLLFNMLIIIINVVIGWAYNVHIDLLYYLIFVPIFSFTLALPISINGLGVREGAYVALFTQAGVAQSVALAMSLTFYAVTLAIGLMGGVLYAVENALTLRRLPQPGEMGEDS
nr:lysylphosphatidylglycerol synthase transmembrane domain-containing protein [Ardenticatena sp.]